MVSFQEGDRNAKRLMPPEVYSMDAVNDERTLKDIESYERFQKKLQDQIEQGLSKCTKLLEEREFGASPAHM